MGRGKGAGNGIVVWSVLNRAGERVAQVNTRAEARRVAKGLGGQRAGFVANEYREARKPRGLSEGKDLSETRGHAKNTMITGQKPKFYQTPRTDPDVYGITSGKDTRSLNDVRLLRQNFGRVKGDFIKVSIKARWAGEGDDTPDILPMDQENPDAPAGTRYRKEAQWVGVTRSRSQLDGIIRHAEREAKEGVSGRTIYERFAWRACLSPATGVVEVAFEQMPGRRSQQ